VSELTNNHRLTLRRSWIGTGGQVNWLMLNPSTATDTADDPTIRKCIGFSKRWGFSRMVVTNLFAFRATDPKDLHVLLATGRYDRAVGAGNDEAIANAANESGAVVVAWGANAGKGLVAMRVRAVMRMFQHPSCIGLTKDGHPPHPCMAGYTDAPIIFASQTEAQ
jgi:hypothetical protein